MGTVDIQSELSIHLWSADSLCTHWAIQTGRNRFQRLVNRPAERLWYDSYSHSDILFYFKDGALMGYNTHTHTKILVCKGMFECRRFVTATHTHRSTESILFSIFYALGLRHTRSDRNLAKWDKIIKLQSTLPSFSAKWIKWCQHVIVSPSGSKILEKL